MTNEPLATGGCFPNPFLRQGSDLKFPRSLVLRFCEILCSHLSAFCDRETARGMAGTPPCFPRAVLDAEDCRPRRRLVHRFQDRGRKRPPNDARLRVGRRSSGRNRTLGESFVPAHEFCSCGRSIFVYDVQCGRLQTIDFGERQCAISCSRLHFSWFPVLPTLNTTTSQLGHRLKWILALRDWS